MLVISKLLGSFVIVVMALKGCGSAANVPVPTLDPVEEAMLSELPGTEVVSYEVCGAPSGSSARYVEQSDGDVYIKLIEGKPETSMFNGVREVILSQMYVDWNEEYQRFAFAGYDSKSQTVMYLGESPEFFYSVDRELSVQIEPTTLAITCNP